MARFLIVSLATLTIAVIMLRLLERYMVFFPSKYPSGFWQPQRLGLAVEDVWVTTSDNVRIHGWFVPSPSPVATLLMAHGNAGNLSDRSQWLAMMLRQVPANLFMFDYRGYGRSQGSPSELGCYLDAEAAYDWLRQHHADLPIIAHGHSLGSAVVIELARRRELDGLILESAFTGAKDMAHLMFGPIPVAWLTSMKWASDEKVASLTMPKLFLHGDRDSVVPYKLGRRLFALAAEPKQFVTLAGCDHNDTFISGGDTYYQTIRDFVVSCTRQPNDAKGNE